MKKSFNANHVHDGDILVWAEGSDEQELLKQLRAHYASCKSRCGAALCGESHCPTHSLCIAAAHSYPTVRLSMRHHIDDIANVVCTPYTHMHAHIHTHTLNSGKPRPRSRTYWLLPRVTPTTCPRLLTNSFTSLPCHSRSIPRAAAAGAPGRPFAGAAEEQQKVVAAPAKVKEFSTSFTKYEMFEWLAQMVSSLLDLQPNDPFVRNNICIDNVLLPFRGIEAITKRIRENLAREGETPRRTRRDTLEVPAQNVLEWRAANMALVVTACRNNGQALHLRSSASCALPLREINARSA